MIKLSQTSLGFLWLTGLLVSATSCSQLLPGNGNAQTANNNFGGFLNRSASNNGQPSEKQLLTKKFNAFVDCNNRVSENIFNNYQNYIDETKDQPLIIGSEEGGSGSAKSSSSRSEPLVESVSQYDVEAVEALKKAIDSTPQIDPLDSIGREYTAAFDQVQTLTKDAADYYKQKNYKDDNFKRAHKMHHPLLTAFSDFENVSKRMSAEIDRLEDTYLQSDFAELEKQNVRDADYEILNLRINAKRLYQGAKAKDVTQEKFDPLLQNFSRAVEEVKRFVQENKEKNANTPQKGAGTGLDYSDGTVYGESFQIEAKEFGRHLRDEHKIAEWGSGSLKSLTDAYNGLVNTLNGSSANIPMPEM